MSRGGFADDPISVGPGSCSGKNTPLNANIAILARSGPRNLRIKREREARTRNISLTHRWNDCANFLDRQIHGFYVPQFNFKSPLIVNRENNAFDERRISTSHLCIPKKETRGNEQDISRWEEFLRTSNLDPAPVKRNSLKMDNSEMLRRVEPIFFSRNPWQKSLGALPSSFEESEYFSNGTILRGIFRSR